jgi:hypothetical protein
MRRSRLRRREGLRCYTHDTEINGLVRRGLLHSGEQDDRRAVRQALYRFLDLNLVD